MVSIREAICWSGPAVVILFTIGRAESRLEEGEFDVSGIRPDEVGLHEMSSEPRERQAVVWEYDLTFEDGRLDDPDFPAYLRECLRKSSARAEGIAWLTFEGAFHFDHLFTDDIADQIYGYCVAGDEPVVTWDREIMRSDRWKGGVRGVRAVLDSTFPTSEERICREILGEGLDDWVPVDRLVGLSRELSERHGGSHRDVSEKVLAHLLRSGLVNVGDLGESGFEAWSGDAEGVVRRAMQALDEVGWEPAGGVCWLANTPAGDREVADCQVI